MTNALVSLEPRSIAELQNVAQIFASSGMFSDARAMAQAFVKIMAGRELGFGAFASMNGIYIVQGRPTMGANLIAAAIKRHPSPRYDYRVVELTNDSCTIVFLQDGEKIGESCFTMEDARLAKLDTKDPWKKNPRNMLFARAMSNGAKWYCPDVFGGPVYTPEEMGADETMDDGGNLIVNVVADEIAPLPESAMPELPELTGQPDDGPENHRPRELQWYERTDKVNALVEKARTELWDSIAISHARNRVAKACGVSSFAAFASECKLTGHEAWQACVDYPVESPDDKPTEQPALLDAPEAKTPVAYD